MPTVFSANESQVLVDGEVVEGVRSIEYRHLQERNSLYALGSAERIGTISGAQLVEGRIQVASTSVKLNGLTGEAPFQILANLQRGRARMTVTFDECLLQEKSFSVGVGGHGEATYAFTATRVREELA
jgi:hypothetical protein